MRQWRSVGTAFSVAADGGVQRRPLRYSMVRDVTPQPTVSAQTTPADRPLREVRGVVERITYQNVDTGYTVARLAPERAGPEGEVARGDDRLVTLVGTLADLTPGEAIVAEG